MDDYQDAIESDWLSLFPELSKYKHYKYYKIIGPLVAGIELIRLPRMPEYRPHFVCYGLWEDGPKAYLRSPTLLIELRDNKGKQLDIPYVKHATMFAENLKTISNQIPVSFIGNVHLGALMNCFDHYIKTSSLRAAPFSYLAAQRAHVEAEIFRAFQVSRICRGYFGMRDSQSRTKDKS